MLLFVKDRVGLILLSAASGLAGLAVVLVVELIAVGWDRSTLNKFLCPSASFRRDIISYFVDITDVLAVVGNLAALGTAFYYGHLVRQYLGLNLLRSVPGIIAQNLLLIFVIGFFDYWMHRLMHKVPWMWEIHKYHPSATEMSVVTARRDSILVVPLATFFKAIPFAVLGIPRAMDEKHLDKNYAFLLPIWDQLFGTFYAERDEVVRIGLDDGYYNKHPYPAEMLWGLRSSVQRLFRSASNRGE